MKEMFEASVDGEAYDLERWGQYFKPAGLGSATGDPNKATSRAAAPAPVADEDDAPFDTTPAPKAEAAPAGDAGGASRAQDILAMIRNRQK
jgi:hypothetical protein